MKKYWFAGFIMILPLFLSACGAVTNTNSITLDLTNTTPTNTASVNTNSVTNTSIGSNTNVTTNTNTTAKAVAKDISITGSAFSPSTITIAAGTTVTWTNNSGGEARISSDPHPTHTDLPGLDSSSLANGGTYSFTFTQVGSWGYHNHFSPTMRGTVVVE